MERAKTRGDGGSGGWVTWVVPVGVLVFHLLTLARYGYFRDELYYLASTDRLALGYVDHPPLSVWLLAAGRALFGAGVETIRVLPAVAAAGTVGVVGLTARALDGGRYAVLLAQLAAALAPVYVSLASFWSMNAFDLLFWALGFLVLVRVLREDDPGLWPLFGLVAGLALMNKISFLFLGFGLAMGLLADRRWRHLRSGRLWLGAGLAVLLFLPHVVWQVVHGWPTLEFMANAAATKNVAFAPLAFLGEQVLLAGPGAVPLALAGLAFLLGAAAGRRWRPLGWAVLAILAVMLATNAKPYYFAGAFLILFAGGGVAVERWTAGWPRAGLAAARGVAIALVASSLVALPLAKPLLAVEDYIAYAARLGLEPSADERHELGRLPQQFADRHGWPELAASVADVARSLPLEDRSRACVFTENYGQAGALELFGPGAGLTMPVLSGHNSYFLWGPGGCTGEVLLVLGGERNELAMRFEEVDLGGTHACIDCMPYEDDKTIWIARGLREPLDRVWPSVKHYD